MGAANLYSLTRSSELNFIFAAFFRTDLLMYIRLGHAQRPYIAVRSLVRLAPWPLTEAVHSHIGDLRYAQQFDRIMRHRLRDYRQHGDWYAFDPDRGQLFATVARLAYFEIVGRPLRWQRMELPVVAERITR